MVNLRAEIFHRTFFPLPFVNKLQPHLDAGDLSEVKFKVEFELKNKILNILMIKSFDLGLKKIANAFEKRAKSLF